eukprot:Plantae.Rhodophyta-Hildenbrandia_rubra.ctg3348.p1 GENE.Plantae.Rhodophyta-Hildenbrandia_rubra.ctg3348~~Plantae.Rhodophyta-Hildenbrandia_rubra.ctg3348.p1  ORF type:complete len:594 (+),score=94.84 Plantae.Rhodophyta-Hildenbrandia_rubra.ctg3348:168-1949(+)
MSRRSKRPSPVRISGVILKDAEVLTRRLLRQQPALYPTYTIIPDLSTSVYLRTPKLPPLLHSFLYTTGFQSLPASVDPGWSNSNNNICGVPRRRLRRKRAQIANVVAAVSELLLRRGPQGVVVDFCGGCGYVGLVIGVLFPGWKVVVVDFNEVAIEAVNGRAKVAGLENVEGVVGKVQDWKDGFDVGVALHACGVASDLVMQNAVVAKAGMVVVPCCVGGLGKRLEGSGSRRFDGDICMHGECDMVMDGNEALMDGGKWTKPRGQILQGVVSDAEYALLAKVADYGEGQTGNDEWRTLAKSILEQDRATWIERAGYQIRVSKMRPLDCSPKNDMIICWPKSWSNGCWTPDITANEVIATVCNAHILQSFDESTVRIVEKEIQARVLGGLSEEDNCMFAKGKGPRYRKIVHAVAEAFGLYHKSIGKGAARAVVVRKARTGQFYFDGYIGCRAQFVEELANSYTARVPTQCLEQRLLLRGSRHHITVIGPQDMRNLKKSTAGMNADQVLQKTFRLLEKSRPKSVGLGLVSEQLKSMGKGRNAMENNDAYYVVLDWPEARRLRKKIGLRETDFHITLGFTVKDIHGVCKGQSTLIR